MQKNYLRHLLTGAPYNGRSLKATHAKYEIHHEHMDHAKELLGLSFMEAGVEAHYVEEILMTLEPSRKDIVTVSEIEQLAARMEETAV
jgi:truncated hemoglobin YjbI